MNLPEESESIFNLLHFKEIELLGNPLKKLKRKAFLCFIALSDLELRTCWQGLESFNAGMERFQIPISRFF